MAEALRILHKQASAAAWLGLSESTLAKWRVTGGGPKFIKLGAAVRYDEKELEVFVANGARRSTSDQTRAA